MKDIFVLFCAKSLQLLSVGEVGMSEGVVHGMGEEVIDDQVRICCLLVPGKIEEKELVWLFNGREFLIVEVPC